VELHPVAVGERRPGLERRRVPRDAPRAQQGFADDIALQADLCGVRDVQPVAPPAPAASAQDGSTRSGDGSRTSTSAARSKSLRISTDRTSTFSPEARRDEQRLALPAREPLTARDQALDDDLHGAFPGSCGPAHQ